MNFNPTPEQTALRDSVRRFREREYDFERRNARMSSGDGFSPETWTTFVELGWLGAGLPEELGGYGGGPVENALILEELGRGLILEPFLPVVVAAQVIAALAEPDQRDALIAGLLGGETLPVLAHRERMETRAERAGEGWRLRGAKSFVLGGPHANLLLVTARVEGGGLSLFQTPASQAGIARRDYRAVDGRRVCDFTFDAVELDAGALIGAEGKAGEAVELALDHLAIGLCAEALGAMDSALWLTRDYLTTRKQFGATLNTFQALQHRMADMLVETELARSMLYRGLAGVMEADPVERRRGVSAAKAQIGEAGYFVGAQAVQLHGGIGVTEEHIVGHYFKRLAFARNFAGSTDEHLARFARLSRTAE